MSLLSVGQDDRDRRSPSHGYASSSVPGASKACLSGSRGRAIRTVQRGPVGVRDDPACKVALPPPQRSDLLLFLL
jgi:hypothetical protein